MSDMTGLLVSAVLSGLGGALFGSAERAAYAALNPGPNQGSRFALLYMAQSAGTTLGPLVGAMLLSLDFRILSVVAGFLYLPIAAMIAIYLPNLSSGREHPAPARAVVEVVRSVQAVSRNRAFVAYCLISAGFWAISGQINISLSLYATSVTGNLTSVKYLLLISSIMVIALQYQLQNRLAGRMPLLMQWALGSAVAGAAFLFLLPFPGMGGLVATVVFTTLGSMVLRPVDYEVVIGMAPRDSVASYYGFAALAVAVGGSIGQFLGGNLTDVASATGHSWLPWVTFAVLGVLAAIAMLRFSRTNPLQQKEAA